MAIIKCKMCGGDLHVEEGSSVCECEYCGTKQTVPKADNEKKIKLFERANRLRSASEFDKAAGVYETIIADFDDEAEAYWGLVLCKYGIEYVDDPTTGKKIPTCHRSSFDSVMKDANFEQACENADAVARRVYRDEARQIEELRKSIIEVSDKEEPYDVFISYKEKNSNGERTQDSVLAQEIYRELSRESYRVFFSRISLEDKLGTEYEPYIFAALNSAKVMIVVGTDYENFDAVWVKNEWSRFLKLIAKGERKTLIPVFKNMDAYDMPEEFNKLIALDMGKIGAMQDLIHGVEKIVGKKKANPALAAAQSVYVPQPGGPNVTAIMERGNLALEDGEWEKAKSFFDQTLNVDARNADAYLGLAMAEAKTEDRNSYAIKYTEANSVFRESRFVARARQFDRELDAWFAELDEQARRNILHEERVIEQSLALLDSTRIRFSKAKGMISAGRLCSAAVDTSGKVYAVGDNSTGRCNISQWHGIVSVAVGINETIGLRSDGTVMSTKLKLGTDWGQCEVYDRGWSNIVMIASGGKHTVGLRADGTVVATRYINEKNDYEGQCDVTTWRNIIEISASVSNTVGLQSDGTVVLTGTKLYRREDVLKWKDIVSISCGADHIVGLKKDGTVVAAGSNTFGQCDVLTWGNIVAVSAGTFHTVGLKADGTVISTRFSPAKAVPANLKEYCGQCDIEKWNSIVAISAGRSCTIGITNDGRVLSTRYVGDPKKNYGQCEVNGWKLFRSVDTIDTERRDAAELDAAAQRAAEKLL